MPELLREAISSLSLLPFPLATLSVRTILASLVGELDSPYVIRLIEFYEKRGEHENICEVFMVFELCEGKVKHRRDGQLKCTVFLQDHCQCEVGRPSHRNSSS